jgi:hypothetical protein
MRYHHDPASSGENQLAHVIHLANYLAKEAGYGSGPDADGNPLEESSLKALTLKQADIEDLSADLSTAVEEITASLNA